MLSEVVVHDALGLHAEAVEVIGDGLDQHGRTAEVVLTVFRSVVVLEVGVAHAVDREAGIVFHAGGISLRIRTVEGEMHVEVGELLLQFPEVFEEERLGEGAGTIEEVHLTVGAMDLTGHVHDL